MDARLDNTDWEEVFKYAEPKPCESGHTHGPTSTLPPFLSVSQFTRDDVAEIIALEDGLNEETDWIGVFRLADGRFACIRAWCDYTGWG